jgi:DNA repair protein RadC
VRGAPFAEANGMQLIEGQTSAAPLPREQALAAGLEALSDSDLVALLIGTGTRGHSVGDLAEEVLRHAGGLEGIARVGPAHLAQLRGLGEAKAYRISASIEVGRRLALRRAAERRCFATAEDVARVFTARIGALDHEEMWVVSVDGRNRLRGSRRVAQGGRHGLSVTSREVLCAALIDAASAFILVHNHPSGSPVPSAADIEMTRHVVRAADVVGVPLLDHVIVTASGAYRSLLDEEVLSGGRTRDHA